MADEAALAAKVRDAIRAGRLPARGANRTCGGPGNGAICAVCGEPVTRSQMELEIEFNRHGTAPAPGLDRYHLHTKCFAAWEASVRRPGPT